jgi:hypothetical protein
MVYHKWFRNLGLGISNEVSQEKPKASQRSVFNIIGKKPDVNKPT